MTLRDMTLQKLLNRIEVEAPMVDKRPYSHNIISMVLREIDKKFGKATANKAILDFKLDKKGWTQE